MRDVPVLAAARRRRSHAAVAAAPRPAEFDMTPMIDCTFQLIVFFLVANDLSQREIEELDLPAAAHADADVAPESDRVLVNVLRPRDPDDASSAPRLVLRGREVGLVELSRELQARASQRRAGPPGHESEVAALVRADRAVPWRHVQTVLETCAAPTVRIRRVQFAATRPEALEGGAR